jgi:ABC-type transport system involved in cytochrome c biogenesis permease subunit
MIEALHGIALGIYLIAALVLATSFAEARAVAPRTGVALVALAAAAHAAALLAFVIRFDRLPLTGGGPAISMLAFIVALCSLVAMHTRDARPLGLVLTPLIAVFLVVAHLLHFVPSPGQSGFRGAWFGAHVVLSLSGFALLAVAFAAGLFYLLQFRELKGKRFGRVFRYFPPLETLDRIGGLAVAIGFPALTAGLVLGWAWTLRYLGTWAAGDPQVIWGVVTWCALLAGLVSHAPGRSSRLGAAVSVGGFVVVVLVYVVLRVWVSGGRVFL